MAQHNTVRIRANLGMMAAAVLIICMPHVNVIDVTPDCIAWLLAALSMTTLAYISEEIAYARRYAWILFGITAVKLLPTVFSVLGTDVFPLMAEPTMVLVYTLCFGAAECFLGIYVFRKWLSEIAQIGLLHESKASIRGIDSIRFITGLFFLGRFIFSFLPELVYLRSTEYLGNVVYGVVIDIRDYRPYLIFICVFAAGILGLSYAAVLLRYFRGIAKETDENGAPLFAAALERHRARDPEAVICRQTLERFAVAFGMMIVGTVFLCHLSVENVNVLPDFIGCALLLGAVAILRPYLTPPPDKRFWGIGVLTVGLAIPYYAVRTWHSVVHHGFWAENVIDYFRRNIVLSPEKQAEKMGLQLDMLLLSVIETALLIAFFCLFLKIVRRLDTLSVSDGVTLYDSMTKDMMRAEQEAYARRPKKVLIWFCMSASMEVVRALPVFSFVVTPIAVVRIIVNLIFVCVFASYITALGRVILYHFKYNKS